MFIILRWSSKIGRNIRERYATAVKEETESPKAEKGSNKRKQQDGRVPLGDLNRTVQPKASPAKHNARGKLQPRNMEI